MMNFLSICRKVAIHTHLQHKNLTFVPVKQISTFTTKINASDTHKISELEVNFFYQTHLFQTFEMIQMFKNKKKHFF